MDLPEFKFELSEHRSDEDAQMLFVHLVVHKWSKSTLHEMLRVFSTFRQCVSAPLFAIGIIDDDKWERFVTRFGFKPFQNVICENGELRRLYMNLKDTN